LPIKPVFGNVLSGTTGETRIQFHAGNKIFRELLGNVQADNATSRAQVQNSIMDIGDDVGRKEQRVLGKPVTIPGLMNHQT
jgi:hypothetical protein